MDDAAMPAVVSVQNLVKRYGSVEAVRGVSFDVEEGEVFAILGPNGAGKTSTLECAVGLRTHDGGTISICGLDARFDLPEIKQRIGVQLQATALQESITVREAMEHFSCFYRRRGDLMRLLQRFGLEEKADARFETLSGGQKQRLAVALALLNEPQVLFLDEPTANLDPQSRRQVHEVIRAMKLEGRSVVLSTHYIDEAEQLCDRVAIIDHGQIIAQGNPGELIAGASGSSRVTFKTRRPIPPGHLERLGSVKSVGLSNEEGTLSTDQVGRAIIELVKVIEEDQNELMDLSVRKPSLEDVFLELTGRALRD